MSSGNINNSATAPSSSEDVKPQEKQSILLRVALEDRKLEVRIKKTGKLSKLMDAACKHFGVEREAVRFLFDGTRVNGMDTPESMELEDGDIIEVFQEQDGGRRI